MDAFVLAGPLLVVGALQWGDLVPRPVGSAAPGWACSSAGEATAQRGWFRTDDRGVHVVQRFTACALMAASAVCAWIGLPTLLTG